MATSFETISDQLLELINQDLLRRWPGYQILNEHVERYKDFNIPVPEDLLNQIQAELALEKLRG